MIAFGPVPSRRLGKSLGINNIPPKICTYSCVYCQIGRTKNFGFERNSFYSVKKIESEVETILKKLKGKKEQIDYLSFVPDGEPTLDINLGKEIENLKKFGIKIAVITNASLIWMESVREDLAKADWVSVKVDAVSENVWKKVSRPYRKLALKEILQGIEKFSAMFQGTLVTETMLVSGINDTVEELEKIARFLKGLNPDSAYIGIPTRPPAEELISPPNEEKINIAYQIFVEKCFLKTELLTGLGGTAFGFTGNVKEDILNITSVHPMREDQVSELLKKANKSWNVLSELIESGKIKELKYQGKKYYLRKL